MKKLDGTLPYVSLLAFSSMALTRVCDPMLTTLSSEYQVSIGHASRVISWYAVAYGAMQLLWGPLGDRLGKVRVVIWAGLACAVLCGVAAFVSDFALLVGVRVAMGAMAAAILPLSMAWIGDAVAYEERQQTLAQLMAASVTGMMAGQWFGGLAAEHLGWRWAFGALAAAFLAASVLLRQRTGGQRPVPAQTQQSLLGHMANSARLLAKPRVRWVLGASALEGALVFGPLAFAPSQLTQAFGASITMAGALMMLYGAGGLAYALFAKRWLRAFGERGLSLLGGILVAASLLLLGWAREPTLGALACALGGLGFYMLHNTLQTHATQMAPEGRGAAVALFASALFLGQSFGVGTVALLLDRSPTWAIYSVAAFAIAALGWAVSRRIG